MDRERDGRQGEYAPQSASHAGGQSSKARIDWNAALDVAAGDRSLLGEVLEAFQEETPRVVAEIRKGFETRDAALLHRSAHTAKNSFYNIGAQETGDLAFELEKLGKQADYDRAAPLVRRLESQMEEVEREINEFLAES